MDNKNNINSKTPPNLMRTLLKRMRNKDYVVGESRVEKPEKNLTIRDMLKITRRLNEDAIQRSLNKKTVYDQSREEERFKLEFKDLNVSIKFIDLEVYDNLVFWGGTIDGVIQFIYKVTPDEKTSGVEFNYVEDFSPDNPENDEIVERIESYYDSFYKYWRDNVLSDRSTEEKPDERPEKITKFEPQSSLNMAAESKDKKSTI